MIGTKLAHYEITSHIGSGGMGDVYQATDKKLGRSVAIKFLPEAFSHDTDRVARFQREARVLASLNHPNIAAIYGVEEIDTRHFLVIELVPGETLADRIKRGAIPIEEALPIAKQIAEALEEAHEKGIIHRDLKPANIKVTPDGKVKVLDFGLAKAYEREQANVTLSNSPTISMAATNAGVILGTAAYMSPEQAKGRAVDRRTDIWAFGCVLYEMLAGRAAFDGEDVADTLGAVLKSEPDWTRLSAEVSPAVRRLLRLCLEKNAKNRRSSATDVRLDIEQAVAEPVVGPTTSSVPNARLLWIVIAAAILVAAVLVIPAVRHLRETSVFMQPVRFRVPFPAKTTPGPRSLPALSPDGKRLAFVAMDDASGESRVWIHELDGFDSHPLAGTDGAFGTPFWSADSRFIVFGTAKVNVPGSLRKVDVSGGPALTLAELPSVLRGGFQAADGTLIFGVATRALLRVSPAGGTPAPLTSLNEGESGHRFPSLLPDGQHFVYLRSRGNSGGIYLGSLTPEKNQDRLLLEDGANPVYAPSGDRKRGYVLFTRNDALLALPFDEDRLEVVGEPVPVAQGVGRGTSDPNFALIAGSASGVVAYQESGFLNYRKIEWFDRQGAAVGAVGEPNFYGGGSLSLSPNGTRLAAEIRDQGRTEIWLFDIQRGGRSRLVSNAGSNWGTVWSPDASAIAFTSTQAAPVSVYRRLLDAGSEEVRLLGGNSISSDWSHDGRFLLFTRNGDLWVLPDPGKGSGSAPIRLTNTPFTESGARFSQDGKWIAYVTDQSGDPEVYLRAFDSAAPTTSNAPGVPVSTNGGRSPRWRADGKELFYLANGQVMVVTIPTQPALKLGSPEALFAAPRSLGVEEEDWDVAPDGQRFLFLAPVDEGTSPPFTVLLNWQADLRR
jgi:Tol biopolymer transport system component